MTYADRLRRKWNPDEMSNDAYRMRGVPVLGKALQFYDDLKQPVNNSFWEGQPALSDLPDEKRLEMMGTMLPVDSGGLAGMLSRSGAKTANKLALQQELEDKIRRGPQMESMNPYLKGVKEGDELIGMHNLTSDNLEHAQEMGGLPVPSIGITKASSPIVGFGDISLIAKQQMVEPGRGNPVFDADVYSRRYPTVEYVDDVDKIFKGFTYGGNRRYAPHTLENVVKEMKGPVVDREGVSYGAGSLRSKLAHKFRNFKGIQKARNNIVPEKEMEVVRDEMNERLFNLADDLTPYDKHGRGNEMGYGDIVTARLDPTERLSDYYKDIPQKLQNEIGTFKHDLKNAPTAYFEAKPQRAVKLQEFGGAIVPDNVDARILEILKRNGIENVERYGDKTKAEAMQNFRDLMFGVGGGGFLASQLMGQDPNERF